MKKLLPKLSVEVLKTLTSAEAVAVKGGSDNVGPRNTWISG